ncbi:restriction endonuclease subunit S [Gelidibacter salicanalis]|uniref:Restriction endonuclease subunit S n=1 Tax=Gelidibacter salicanalis TaxID=291193 RepID=A0A934KUG0_9FLAO|nr:restriction endonuclease subunit S [Gelidibacter salicanalis]MBJ7880998.1 restriction endonuclease subunit S [Gelidibacter salicanalis]
MGKWKEVKVEDIAKKIQYGYTGKTIKKGDYRYLRITDIQNQSVNWSTVPISDVSSGKDIEKYKLEINDILFARTGATVGKSFLIEDTEPSIFASYLIRVQPKEIVFPKYLYLYFQSESYWKQIRAHEIGAAQPNVNGKKLGMIKFPLPPLVEQQRIVTKLDTLFTDIDEAIRLLEENIAHTQALMGSVLDEEFGTKTPKHKLGEFDKIKAGGTPSRSNKSYWNGKIPWLTSRELNTHYISESVEKITEEGLNNSNAKIFTEGTLLCGMYDTAAMKMSILKIDATCNQAIVGIKPKEDILNVEFLKFQLEFQKPEIMRSRRGVRQKNLNATMIKDLNIWVPALKEQNMIVQKINKSNKLNEKLIQVHIQKLTHLKSLKSSLLDQAFKGEL